MQKIEIINPIEFPGWDDLVLSTPEYSFFHSSLWARVLAESYDYKPLYFTVFDEDRLLALIPVMQISSVLTGRRGVSLPFTDYCQPFVCDKINPQEIIHHLIVYGRKTGWKYIELRGGERYFQSMPPSSFYYEHILDLTLAEQKIFESFRSSTRRNIIKARRQGVDVELCYSLRSIIGFYRLNCITRRHHRLPPQPFSFFKKIFEHIISKGYGLVVLASYSEKIIAGAVFFHLGDKSVYKYGASDLTYQHLRPNNIVMWEAIRYYASRGFKSLSFGRTEPENDGLLQFKRGWGTREETLKYYKYDLTKDAFIKDRSRVKVFPNLFSKMPISLLNIVGSILYRHVG